MSMDSSTAVEPHSIPDAVLPYPDRARDRAKYVFWKAIYPLHNGIRNVLLASHVLHPPYNGRQDYVIGFIAPGRTVEGLLKHLEKQEFGNHFIAWEDDDQVASLRRLESFIWQYHLRIFKDGEVRGHYELTPEAHPFHHYHKRGQCARKEDFSKFLGDWVVPAEEVRQA